MRFTNTNDELYTKHGTFRASLLLHPLFIFDLIRLWPLMQIAIRLNLNNIFKVGNTFCISSQLVWYQTRHSLVNKQFDLIFTIWPSFGMNFDPIISKIFFRPIFEFYSTRQLIWYQTNHVLGHFNTWPHFICLTYFDLDLWPK